MINVKKTIGFKLTALLLALLFVFQADCLLAMENGNQDIEKHEEQYRLAEQDFNQGNHEAARIRLERLLKVLNVKKEKLLLEKVEEKLKIIATLKETQGEKPGEKVIEREAPTQQKKKKKKFPVLLATAGVVAAGVLVYSLTKKKKTSKKANINISFSPNVVYQSSDEKWHYTIFLRETNGVGATLTDIDSNNWKGGSIEDVFETNHISPYGTLTADLYSEGYTSETIVTYHIWGNDDNGHTNLKWSGSLRLIYSSSNQSSKEMITAPIDAHSH
jgi:hypothetical protein